MHKLFYLLFIFLIIGCLGQGTMEYAANGHAQISTDLSISKYSDLGPLKSSYDIVPTNALSFSKITLDLGTGFAPSNICSTYTIFGLNGEASCGGNAFGLLVSSNLFRDVGTQQITIATERSLDVNLPNGFRWIPKISSDDDGYQNSSIIRPKRPFIDCGISENTISQRIDDCMDKNGTCSDAIYNNKTSCEGHLQTWSNYAYWDGETNAINGQALWKLVTCTGSKEVWQDQRTGFLWSGVISNGINWCQATGNSNASEVDPKYREADTSNYCDNSSYQNQTNPISACFEDSGFVAHPDSGDSYSRTFGDGRSSYGDAKGYMGPNAVNSPKVFWRLPTIYDFEQADIDGIRFIIRPEIDNNRFFWSATIYTYNPSRTDAWTFTARSGYTYHRARNDSNVDNHGVLCIGFAAVN